MAKEKKLGKGLDAIFGGDVSQFLEDLENKANEIGHTEISLSELRPNPYQPRRYFDDEKIEELADSISSHGVFTPIIVNKSIKGYDIVAGERRVRASKVAGLTTIPAIIVEFSDEQMMEISLLENIQRENLNAIEEAQGYKLIIDRLGITQDVLAKRIGKSRTHITNILRLLQLPNFIQECVLEGKLTMGHVRPLITLDPNKSTEIANRAINENLSVRDVENIVRGIELGASKKDQPKKEKDIHITAIESTLRKRFGTKVKIENQTIQLKYTDIDDLNRILELLGIEE